MPRTAQLPSLRSLMPALMLASAVLVSSCVTVTPPREAALADLRAAVREGSLPLDLPPGTQLDSILVRDPAGRVDLYFSKELSYMPFRPATVQTLNAVLRDFFREAFPGYEIRVHTLRQPIEQLVPNFYRPRPQDIDLSRIPRRRADRPPAVVRNVSRPYYPSRGLSNRNIVLWPSHGWYYSNRDGRWEWQRPRLFQSVEDLGPLAITTPYLIPMLERAGATVYVPRERDIQDHEALVDNDTPGSGYTEWESGAGERWERASGPGFGIGSPPYPANVNPFQQGTARRVRCATTPTASATWSPKIPARGMYAVYVAFPASDSSVSDARYVVRHLGGATHFLVNQRVGGGTWHYLGHFLFAPGRNDDSGSVQLVNISAEPGRYVSADGARFGGGRGNIVRGDTTSRRPRFVEGARYYLQFAGMPDTLVYNLNNNENEYRDDYQSRGEYVNYLYGAPYGPNKDRSTRGLGIPIDLSLAFHTDAGITHNDTTVGTLLIYSLEGFDSTLVFPDTVSRLANRDLADILQTQIVQDLRTLHDPTWNRRQLRNGDYSEAVRPNVPAALLELLSHQNFLDMRFFLEPQFRFDVARAIYKAMLRYLSVPDNSDYVVQPLPVSHLRATITDGGDVLLRWNAVVDSLESSAVPDRYIVYTRMDQGGFDNGTMTFTPEFLVRDIVPGRLYSFFVTAVNDGGESMPSEVMCAGRSTRPSRPALIVNGFDRVAGPAVVEAPAFEGFANFVDAGVPDRIDLNFTGHQYDFSPASLFRTNDGPGHGASTAEDEALVFAGNTFDFVSVHGASLLRNNRSFVSSSDEAIMDTMVRLSDYSFVDFLFGEERGTPRVRRMLDSLRGMRFEVFPRSLQEHLTAYCRGGGKLFLSGSYIGSDPFAGPTADSSGKAFVRDVLRYSWAASHAGATGVVEPAADSFLPRGSEILFQTRSDPFVYGAEAVDALIPAPGATVLLRYAENQFTAAVGFRAEYGVLACGFPFETIRQSDMRDAFMQAVLKFLNPD